MVRLLLPPVATFCAAPAIVQTRPRRLRGLEAGEVLHEMIRAQFGRVNATIGSAATGNITSVAVSPRQAPLGLRLVF